MTGRRIAVIGAGLAGLTAARELAAAGHEVTVFEKSRGHGGRMSTRRSDDWRFDHGAQFFTALTPGFRAVVERWMLDGIAAVWQGRFVELPGDKVARRERFVGIPGMSGICRHFAEGLTVRRRSPVEAVRRDSGAWHLDLLGDDPAGPFDAMVVATPAEQAAPLLGAAPKLAGRAEGVKTLPCWAVMVGLESRLDVPYDGAVIKSGALSWIGRDSSKPLRPQPERGEVWVLHATADWSLRKLKADPKEEVIPRLLFALREVARAKLPHVVFKVAHRWRYARTQKPLGTDYLWDGALGIGACGDWCLGTRIESAFLSGRALAARILGG